MKAARWAAALAVLQIADLGTTWLALHNGGVESNGIVLALGWPLTAAIKFLLVGGILAGAHRYSRGFTNVLSVVVVLYAALCAQNLVVAWQGATV